MKTFDITEKLNIKPVDFDSMTSVCPEKPENIIASDLGKPEKDKLADGVFTVDVDNDVWMYIPPDKIQKLVKTGTDLLNNYPEASATGIMAFAENDRIGFMCVASYNESLAHVGITKDYTTKKMFMTNIRTNMFKDQQDLTDFWKKMNYFKILLKK